MRRLVLATALLLLAATAAALDWEYVGMDGVSATTITVDPLHELVFVGTYEGFHYLDLPTGTWTERDWEDWIGRQVYAVDFADDLPGRVITGRENAWFKGYLEVSDDLGATETFVYESTGGRVTDIMHADLSDHWACTWSDVAPGELLRSTDAGVSWSTVGGHGFSAMTDLELPGSGELYVAGDAGVKWTHDDGATWESLNGDLPTGQGVYCICYAYAGGDVLTPTSLFASLDAGVYFSETPGDWTPMLTTSCRRLVSLPVPVYLAPDALAAVTWDGRVLVSRNFGGSWDDETGILPGTPIDAAYCPYDRGLYVLTSTRGLYRFRNVVTETPSAPAARLAVDAWPNPFNPSTTLRIELPAAGPTTLRIHDVQGRTVATLLDGAQPAGERRLVWRPDGLSSGVYLARLSSASGDVSTRLILLK